jgi:prephenate dehydrogenase
MPTTIALFGAAGKMGSRISRRIRESTEYSTLFVESGETGVQRLKDRGDKPTPPAQAAAEADVLILAIPDKLIGKASQELVPLMKPGAMMILLDPAGMPHGMSGTTRFSGVTANRACAHRDWVWPF